MLQHYYNEWADEWTKQGWLDYLQNTYGSFKIAAAQLLPDGTAKWSKHIPYLELQHLNDDDTIPHYYGITKKQFLQAANNRTTLQPEIVLDIENPKQLPTIQAFLNKYHIEHECWTTGSRGYHIHIIEPELAQTTDKEAAAWKATFIRNFGADTMKKSTNAMIALENTPHWKTGKTKCPT